MLVHTLRTTRINHYFVRTLILSTDETSDFLESFKNSNAQTSLRPIKPDSVYTLENNERQNTDVMFVHMCATC